MQRIILVTITLLIISWQSTHAQKFRIGPKAGINLGGIQYVDQAARDTYKSLPSVSYQAGIALNVPVNESFSLQTEFNYTRRNKSIRERDDDFFYHKAQYHHIEIPMLFQYKFGPEHFQWYVNAGPSVSYWLSGKGRIVMDEMGELARQIQDYDVLFAVREEQDYDFNMYTSGVERFQLNLNFGAGLFMELINEHIVMFDLRYRAGQTREGSQTSGDLNLPYFKDNFEALSWDVSFNVAYLIPIDVSQWYKGRSTVKTKRTFR